MCGALWIPEQRLVRAAFSNMLALCCEWKKTQNMLWSGLGHGVSLPQELSWPCTCLEGGESPASCGLSKKPSQVVFVDF